MINKVILVGNLGQDPETRTSNSGMAISKLNIATTERVKDKDGNWGEHTEWHRCTCFGRTAENVTKFLKKGRQVYIEGRLRTSKYQKDGQDRYSTEIIVDTIQFLGTGGGRDQGVGGGRDNDDRGPRGGGGGDEGRGGGGSGGGGGNYGGGNQDDDIPF